jgi:hypothetical protein
MISITNANENDNSQICQDIGEVPKIILPGKV